MVGDRIPPDQYRLVTSVHEAGHSVIAERIGLRVSHIRIVHSGVGYTQPDQPATRLYVEVARRS